MALMFANNHVKHMAWQKSHYKHRVTLLPGDILWYVKIHAVLKQL